MISLFLDTCNSNIIVSLIENDEVIYKISEKSEKDLSIRLLPIIKECFEKCNKDIKEIDCIYVANGPGSFTGIRIGVTVAKVLAYSLNKKIVSISELEVLSSNNTKKEYIVPLIDARRGFVYTGIYDNNLNNLFEDTYISLEEFLKYLNENYEMDKVEFISYDDIEIEENTIIKPDINILKVISNHKDDPEINCHQVNPNYLKKTEAEEKLIDKRNNES